jgi:hypothetical protein
MMPLPAVIIHSHLLIAVADRVPHVDYAQTCRIESQQTGAPQQDYDACKHDEEAALDQLSKQWSKYSSTDRGNCVQSTTGGYLPSYVELVTCLEMYAFLKQLPAGKTNPDVANPTAEPTSNGNPRGQRRR